MITRGRGQWTRRWLSRTTLCTITKWLVPPTCIRSKGSRSLFNGERFRAWTWRRRWGRALSSTVDRRRRRYAVDNVNGGYLRPDLIGR